jgi:hypothetical protein
MSDLQEFRDSSALEGRRESRRIFDLMYRIATGRYGAFPAPSGSSVDLRQMPRREPSDESDARQTVMTGLTYCRF